MDRIIEVKVFGNHLTKDNKNAGTRGEANVTRLRISFDEGWDGYTKKITFWDARGSNPVVIALLPHLGVNDRTYLVPIPAEPMKEEGMLTFVIEGTVDDKVQRSLSDRLEVKYAPESTNAGQPVPPAGDELTQLEGELEKIKADIQGVAAARDEVAEIQAKVEENAQKVEESVGKSSYIGENGNWYSWDGLNGEFYDTGIKAQAGSMVYCGDNPPEEADVWIDPEGEGSEGLLQELMNEIRKLKETVNSLATKSVVKKVKINLPSSAWITEDTHLFSQEVSIDGVTSDSQIELQLSAEQIMIFYEKDVTFWAENENGVVTVYCIGQKPANDYEIQATITEVER